MLVLGKIRREMEAVWCQDVRGRVDELVSMEGTSAWSIFPAARLRGSQGNRYCFFVFFLSMHTTV